MKIVSSWPRFTLAVFFALGPVFASSTVEAADLWARYVQITNTPADGMYSPGAQLDIQYGVHNEVGSPSPDFTISFYLSKDKSTDASAYLLGSLREDGLESWQVRDWTGSLTLPNDIPNGQYYLGMVVICSGDSSSANNVVWASAAIRVGVPGPDLSVQSVDATDGWYSAGEEIAVTVDVKNVSQLVSGGHSIECYACSDAQSTASCRSLGSADFGPLPPMERITCAAVYRFPSPLPDGEYFIRAIVTCGGDNDVRDNVGLDNIKVHVGPHPDLAVQSVDAADGIYMPNGQIVVQTKICNVGGLAPGEQRTHDITCRLPSYVPLGKCYIGVIVTCANDGRTANNVGVDAVPLTIVHPPGYVCGRVTYEDTSAWVHPIRYARVKIYNADNDNDPLNDRLLAQTSTDVDGNFGAVLVHEQTSGPQIYVKVFTEGVSGAYPGTTSTICAVKDDVLKSLYSLKSSLCPYPSDTSTTVNMRSPKTAGEFMVYDSIVG